MRRQCSRKVLEGLFVLTDTDVVLVESSGIGAGTRSATGARKIGDHHTSIVTIPAV